MSTIYINLTQHAATPEQISVGVKDLSTEERKVLSSLLTADDLPTGADVRLMAAKLAHFTMSSSVAKQFAGNEDFTVYAMIGGAPWLMDALMKALSRERIGCVYSFTKREAVETTLPDGSVSKTSVFRHVGFVKP